MGFEGAVGALWSIVNPSIHINRWRDQVGHDTVVYIYIYLVIYIQYICMVGDRVRAS